MTLGQGSDHTVTFFAEALKGQHVAGCLWVKNKNSRPVGAGSSQALKGCTIKRLPRESRRQMNDCSPSYGIGRCHRSTQTRCGPCRFRRFHQGDAACHADERGCCLRCTVVHQRFLHPTVCFGTHVRSSNSLPLFCVPWYWGLSTQRVCFILLSF